MICIHTTRANSGESISRARTSSRTIFKILMPQADEKCHDQLVPKLLPSTADLSMDRFGVGRLKSGFEPIWVEHFCYFDCGFGQPSFPACAAFQQSAIHQPRDRTPSCCTSHSPLIAVSFSPHDRFQFQTTRIGLSAGLVDRASLQSQKCARQQVPLQNRELTCF